MIDRKKIKKCPLCGSEAIEHMLGDHVSKLRGTTHHVPHSFCHNCGEIFLGPDSLEVIRSQERKLKIVGKKGKRDPRQEYNYS